MLPLLAVLALAMPQEPTPAPVTIDGAPAVHEPLAADDVPGRLAKPPMLDLNRYSLYADRRLPDPSDGLRFDTEIEVIGKIKDPNEAMAEWWRHWNFEYSIYGHGINIQKPMAGGGYNILPIIDWLRQKAKERKENERLSGGDEPEG